MVLSKGAKKTDRTGEPLSHAKTQRRKGGRQFSFSSQPKAYQDSIPMSHAKTQSRKEDRQGRGTMVSRKEAKAQRGQAVFV